MSRTQRLWIAGGLGMLAVLVASFALILASVLPEAAGSPAGRAQVTASATPSATPVPVLRVTPSQGWVTVPDMSFVQNVAFSTGEPLIGYACGAPVNKTNPAPIELSVTYNGGLTWHKPIVTPFKYPNCYLSLNPKNARDLLLGGQLCEYGCIDGSDETPYFTYWHRTLDGGQTWHALTLPPGDEASLQGGYLVIPDFSWVGSTLFLLARKFSQGGGGTPLPHVLAESQNGGAFTWYDTPALITALGGVHSNYFGLPFSWQNRLWMTYIASNQVATSIAVSNDNGQTWTHFTPKIMGVAPTPGGLDAMIPAGNRLFGIVYDVAQRKEFLVNSTDNGQTWSPYPVQPPPAFFIGNNNRYSTEFAAPDGTLLVSESNGDWVSLKLGATSWQTVFSSPIPNTSISGITALSWGLDGHPVALWAWVGYGNPPSSSPGAGIYSGPDSNGLAYHAAVGG